MPRYDYVCGGCGEVRELSRPVAERDNVVMCPWCARAMDRESAAPGFMLKGAGFHKNDYAPPRQSDEP